jgi:hypothetical protein
LDGIFVSEKTVIKAREWTKLFLAWYDYE